MDVDNNSNGNLLMKISYSLDRLIINNIYIIKIKVND